MTLKVTRKTRFPDAGANEDNKKSASPDTGGRLDGGAHEGSSTATGAIIVDGARRPRQWRVAQLDEQIALPTGVVPRRDVRHVLRKVGAAVLGQ